MVSQSSNRTEICLDPTGNAIQYINIDEISVNDHFPHKYQNVGVVFFAGGRMGYPARRDPSHKFPNVLDISHNAPYVHISVTNWWIVEYGTGALCFLYKRPSICLLMTTALVTATVDWIWAQYHHDDVIKWKNFPRYWPLVREIHRSPVNSPQRPVTGSFDVFFGLLLNNRLSKQ